jgi:hypothetical protein
MKREKNPHEPNTIQSTAWELQRPMRKAEAMEKAQRKKNTKGAFGKAKSLRKQSSN